LSDDAVVPAYRTCPPYAESYGSEVVDLCRLAGFPPDPEQVVALKDMFGVDAAGRSVAFEFGIVAARQNIKSGLFKQASLGWLFLMDQRLVVWSAHEFSTAQEAFRDMCVLIESCPDLDRRLKRIHRGSGTEAVELMSGARLKFRARTKTGGRGLTGDRVVLDEAFALSADHMGALMPTLSAVPDPQIVYGSSAGVQESHIMRRLRDRGRPGDARLAYHEYCDDLPGECAQPGCDHEYGIGGCLLDDERRWARANSQLGRRITWEYVRAERRTLPASEFARERLGWWDEEVGKPVLDPYLWAACLDPASRIVGQPSFGLDVSADRGWSSLVVAGRRADGLPHVEVTSESGVVDSRAGVDWIVPRLAAMLARWPGLTVTVAAWSAAESLKGPLDQAGVRLQRVAGQDVYSACATLFDAVQSKQVRHLGQPHLDAAARDARRLSKTGENGWKWGRLKSAGDITPLYAATLALWSLNGAAGRSMRPADNIW
jgi:hypothetical protein